MNSPLVNERFPYIPLEVQVRGATHLIEALLDTGFDGYVIVPPGLLDADLPPDSELRCRLADDSEIMAPLSFGSVRVLGADAFPALVLTVGTEPLVGRGVSDRYRITLDHGQRVIVEP